MYNRSGRQALVVLLVLLFVVACATSESSVDLGDMTYSFGYAGLLGCAGTCFVPGSDTVARGDTLGFSLSLLDPTPDSANLPLVRPFCALNLEIRRSGQATPIATVPATVTCPDSTIPGGDNWPLGGIHVDRIYEWKVPDSLPLGTYTITSKVLVSPRVDRSTTIVVH